MDWINQIIRYCYDQGWSSPMYNAIVVIAFVAQFAFLAVYRKKYGFSLMKAFIAVLLIYPAAYFLMLVLAWVENGFKNWGENNIVRLYVYMPLICAAVSKVLHVPGKTLSDYIAPSMALQQVIGHSVCPFVGCCHGYACEWGIWNPAKGEYQFPIQWLECLVALLIVVWLLKQAKKENYSGTGRVYAQFLVMFGGTRFFLEFLRNNDKLVLGISNLAFHALFMTVVGTIWLYVLMEKERENKRKAEKRQQKRSK